MPSTATNLPLVLKGLRYFGKGCKVTRTIFKKPETYWIVADTKLSKDQNHGMVYGQLMWNGQLKPKVERIPGTNKKEWTLLELPDYHTFKG